MYTMVVAICNWYLARVVSNGYWGIPHYDVTLSEFPVDKFSVCDPPNPLYIRHCLYKSHSLHMCGPCDNDNDLWQSYRDIVIKIFLHSDFSHKKNRKNKGVFEWRLGWLSGAGGGGDKYLFKCIMPGSFRKAWVSLREISGK